MTSTRTALVVSYHFPPSTTPGSLRVDGVVTRLLERGWNVVVVTGTGARSTEDPRPGLEIIRTASAAQGPVAPGAAVIAQPRRPVLARLSRTFAIPDGYTGWMGDLTRAVTHVLDTRAIDVVLSSSPPHSSQLALARLHRRRPFRWVAEFRDPWMFPNRRRLAGWSSALQTRMEASVVRSCDRVIANTNGNRTELLAGVSGLDPARVVVIPNGYDASHYGGTPPPPSRFDLTYVGEVYPGMFDVYVEALARLHAQDPSHTPTLEVFGTIDERERRRLEERGLAGFVAHRGFVSHRESVAAMRAARALLLLLPGNDRWRTCVPSKFYWYLAAQRPVIALAPSGDAGALLERLGAGWLVSERDGVSAAAGLSRALEQSRTWNARGGQVQEYDLDHLVERIDNVLREAVDGTAR